MKTNLLFLFASIIVLSSCNKKNDIKNVDFRQEMRNFVQEISVYSKNIDKYFIIVPQNGQELITVNGNASDSVLIDYLASFDATGREDLFYGYIDDDVATPSEDNSNYLSLCNICKQNAVKVLVIDYCSTHSNIDDSYQQNLANGFISFAATERNLNVIPDYPTKPFNSNLNDITKISEAKNFLYLINPENYSTKETFINAVAATDYDLLIIDLFFNDGAPFSAFEIEELKTKQNGAKRLVLCYMSIGEAEDYRFYWQNDWKVGEPFWLEAENKHWKGNFVVRYWEQEWKNIIYGNNDAYLDKIINTGFDGVYLDIIDGFDYFEVHYPQSE